MYTGPDSDPIDDNILRSSSELTPPPPSPRIRLSVFVELSPLDPAKRDEYIYIPLEELSEDFTPDSEVPLEVIGEYERKGELFYFAKRGDGLAYKEPAGEFASKYPSLVSDYSSRRAAGQLSNFDPSASYVHPDSRIRVLIIIQRRRPRIAASSDEEMVAPMDSDSPSQSPSEEEWANDDVEGDSPPPRKSTRNVTKKTRELPFSPKRTRTRSSKRVISVIDVDEEEDEEPEDSDVVTQQRNLTRSGRKNGKEIVIEDSADDQEDEYVSAKPKKTKITRERRGARPAYGFIRNISDLDYESDQDTATLRAHRSTCDSCKLPIVQPLLDKLRKKPKKGKRKRKSDEDDDFEEDEEERLLRLGGWVRCLKCPVVAHWGCLAATQRDEIIRAAQERDVAAWKAQQEDAMDVDADERVAQRPTKRPGLDVDETTEFVCGACSKGGVCMGCLEPVIASAPNGTAPSSGPDADVDMTSDHPDSVSQLLFRCATCKRPAHYAHLPASEYSDQEDEIDRLLTTAEHYQIENHWQCADCISFVYPLEKILAWRPYPPNATEPRRPAGEPINHKASLPREYLVKWENRGYRRAQWVPHMWLLARSPAKLKNFLTGGTKVKLLEVPEPESTEKALSEAPKDVDAILKEDTSMAVEPAEEPLKIVSWWDPLPDAERRIPSAWRTVDRVLDVLLFKIKKKPRVWLKLGKSKRRIDSDADEDDEDPDFVAERDAAYDHGEQPSEKYTETIEEWEKRNKRSLTVEDIDAAIWCFFKWDDLGYEEATWDSPPRRSDPAFAMFERAFSRFLYGRTIPKPTGPSIKEKFRKRNDYMRYHRLAEGQQPNLGQHKDLKLMDFQIDGVNWLCTNWWNSQHCILADEMGLGKTVQIATFVGTIIEKWDAFPVLVVVPNSTVSNWIREFERWAPNIRVVPFYGENRARECIATYELKSFHVLVTTYETVTNPKDFTAVFKKRPRWEALIIDEGQRLKNDNSLLFKKLNELNTIHRIIMTGTPLNNNIRELFNLMNFLDPDQWSDLEALEKEHEVLSEELVKQLHDRLRPYFLRRTKKEVLKLPPKNEVIVPVSMAPLQKEIYKGILSRNLEVLKGLNTSAKGTNLTKSNMNNMLMQLRKCIQHPYLVSEEIEPKGLSVKEMHLKLIEASGKFRLLKLMLPQLKARGHRVLLFSQFVIALDIIEDFLAGEGIKYLRLDGNTKQAERQKGMDEFNREGSDVFIYLLTTRAGGVGINLWTADTVIIFDPDFNPHQDLQAIARAHRFGQKKTVLVFKLMLKESAEEKIMQTGKKKLVLDHLIVQKMDDDDTGGDDVQSFLMYGAQALFNEDAEHGSKEFSYSETDVQNLIEKTEVEGDEKEDEKGGAEAFSFGFKVWAADNTLEDMAEDTPGAEPTDSWAETLARIEAEKAKAVAAEESGRRTRRRVTTQMQRIPGIDDSPPPSSKGDERQKGKKRRVSPGMVDSDFAASEPSSDETDSDVSEAYEDLEAFKQRRRRKGIASPPPLSIIGGERCGLCGTYHEGACYMTQSSDNLVEYRRILMENTGDEPYELRQRAIQAIEETLNKRGHLSKLANQPLHLLREPLPPPGPAPMKPRKRSKNEPGGTGEAHAASAVSDIGRSSHIQRTSSPAPMSALDGPAPPVVPASASAAVPTKAGEPSTVRVASASGASSSNSGGGGSAASGTKERKEKPATCIMCHRKYHSVKDCPIVMLGTSSISSEITRLESDTTKEARETVFVLRSLLRKAKKAELERRGTAAEVIIIEDTDD